MDGESDNQIIINPFQISMAEGDKIIKDLQEIHDQQTRILSYLENDKSTGRKGLVTELHDLKKDMETIKQHHVTFVAEYRRDQAFKAGKNVAWGMVGASLIAIFIWLAKLLGAAIMKIKFGI